MGSKIIYIIGIIILVVATYVLLLALQPVTNTIVQTANSTGNWTNAQDAQAVIVSFPLWQWLLPGFVGLVAIVVTWLKKE